MRMTFLAADPVRAGTMHANTRLTASGGKYS